jgi:hypothetical protein
MGKVFHDVADRLVQLNVLTEDEFLIGSYLNNLSAKANEIITMATLYCLQHRLLSIALSARPIKEVREIYRGQI